MKILKCWCGCETFSPYSHFNTGFYKGKKGVKIKIVKCDNCGTVRMYDNGLAKYPDYETTYNYAKVSGRHLRTVSIINDFCVGKSILDIGANTGLLLNEIKLRIDSLSEFKGIDLDSNAIHLGKEKYGLDLEAIDADSLVKSYDNIVLCHTLEHIQDLKTFANTLDRLLNPGGRLFISIPNIESIGARYFLRFWPALSPKYHLWYFSSSSIERYFNEVLPKYQHLFSSSYFIWKPIVFPAFYWNKIQKNKSALIKLEQQKKGDQLDFVISKPL